MSKVLKYADAKTVQEYNIEKFQGPDLGHKQFNYHVFGAEELSVQDIARRTPKEAAPIGGRSLSPKTPMFSIYEHTQGDTTRVFGEHDKDISMFVTGYELENFEEEPGDTVEMQHHAEELTGHPDEKQPVNVTEEDKADAEQIQKLMARIEALENEKERLSIENNQLKEDVESTRVSAYQNGYDTASKEHADKESAKYEAEKTDYMATVTASLDKVLEEVDKIKNILDTVDQQMPEIVLSYVKEIVGEERVLNDKFILNVVHSAVENLKDIQHVVFTVNPDDAEALADRYPNFGITVDSATPKGNVKIRTKVGEVDLSVDSWLAELEKSINEQLESSQIS